MWLGEAVAGENRVVETALFMLGGQTQACRGAARDIELDLWTVVFLQL